MEYSIPLIWNPILRQNPIDAAHRMNRREETTECPFCAGITNGLVSPDEPASLNMQRPQKRCGVCG